MISLRISASSTKSGEMTSANAKMTFSIPGRESSVPRDWLVEIADEGFLTSELTHSVDVDLLSPAIRRGMIILGTINISVRCLANLTYGLQ